MLSIDRWGLSLLWIASLAPFMVPACGFAALVSAGLKRTRAEHGSFFYGETKSTHRLRGLVASFP